MVTWRILDNNSGNYPVYIYDTWYWSTVSLASLLTKVCIILESTFLLFCGNFCVFLSIDVCSCYFRIAGRRIANFSGLKGEKKIITKHSSCLFKGNLFISSYYYYLHALMSCHQWLEILFEYIFLKFFSR